MGIYSTNGVFGIKMYNYDEDYFGNILFEKKYNTIMSDIQKRDAYLFYKELDNKSDLHFQLYTECSGEVAFLMWYPLSLKLFLETFDV